MSGRPRVRSIIPYAGPRLTEPPAPDGRTARPARGAEVRDTVESPVASVDRALRILALIGGAPTGLSLDELAAKLDIPKSSLHRILAALKFRKFVAQPEVGGAYFLGTELLATAFRFHEMLDLRALIHPLLVQLSAELNETTHMAVLDGPEIVYQDKIEVTTHTIKLSSTIGGRNPAHATGVGKALLAWTYPTDEAIPAWAVRWGALPRPPKRPGGRADLPRPARAGGGRQHHTARRARRGAPAARARPVPARRRGRLVRGSRAVTAPGQRIGAGTPF